jgi:hypothetical protein
MKVYCSKFGKSLPSYFSLLRPPRTFSQPRPPSPSLYIYLYIYIRKCMSDGGFHLRECSRIWKNKQLRKKELRDTILIKYYHDIQIKKNMR